MDVGKEKYYVEKLCLCIKLHSINLFCAICTIMSLDPILSSSGPGSVSVGAFIVPNAVHSGAIINLVWLSGGQVRSGAGQQHSLESLKRALGSAAISSRSVQLCWEDRSAIGPPPPL